jgi:hypothetical protein
VEALEKKPSAKERPLSCVSRMGIRIEMALVDVFTAWGTFCAKHPIIVIVIRCVIHQNANNRIFFFSVS